MEPKINAITKDLKKGQRRWVERGIFAYRERRTGRVRFGISYQAQRSDGGKVRRRELVDAESLGAARKALRAVQVDTSRGQRLISARPLPTFAAYVDEYLHGREREIASLKRSRLALNAASEVFGGVRIDHVAPHHVQDFKRRRMETCEPATVQRDLAVLKHAFRLATKVYRYRADNPAQDVTVARYQEKQRRALSIDEVERLIAASAPHVQPFIRVAVQTGLRLSELSQLQWADVDFAANRITITRSKSRKVQTVPMDRIVRETLLALRGTGRVGWVFLYDGHRLENPKKAIAGAARRAGVGKVTCHVFRHTAATRLIEAGVDILLVKAIMRHASITTTMRYVHGGDLDAAAEKLADYVERAT